MSRVKILVCGGRDYADRERVWRELDALAERFGSLHVIEGGAPGADRHAYDWAMSVGPQKCGRLSHMPADWRTHGRAAGAIRNAEMLKLDPDRVLAFPGGKGTADMVAKAVKAGIIVLQVQP